MSIALLYDTIHCGQSQSCALAKFLGVGDVSKQQPAKFFTNPQGKKVPITAPGAPQAGGQQQGQMVARLVQQQTPQPQATPQKPTGPRPIKVVKSPSLEAAKATVKKLTDLLDPSLEVAGDKWEPREHTKARIAKDISKRLEGNKDWEAFCQSDLGKQFASDPDVRDLEGQQERVAARLMGWWASCSGDSAAYSVAMQLAAQDEFGLTDAPSDHFGQEYPPSVDNAKAIYGQHGVGLRAFLRAMYQSTQDWLQNAGIDSAPVFRGTGGTKGTPKAGELTEVQLQPMSSFSSSPGMALWFTPNARGHKGAVLYTSVPRERIIGTCQTGYGCREETELVLLGGTAEMLTAVSLANLPEMNADELAPGSAVSERVVNQYILPAIVEQGGPESAQH